MLDEPHAASTGHRPRYRSGQGSIEKREAYSTGCCGAARPRLRIRRQGLRLDTKAAPKTRQMNETSRRGARGAQQQRATAPLGCIGPRSDENNALITWSKSRSVKSNGCKYIDDFCRTQLPLRSTNWFVAVKLAIISPATNCTCT